MSNKEEGGKTRVLSVVYTKDKLAIFGFPSQFDPIDDIMFVPVRAPGRLDSESDSLRVERCSFKKCSVEVDLTQWSNETTRNYICREIMKRIVADMWMFSEEELNAKK